MSLKIVAGLRREGVDIVSVGEVGRLSLSDASHVAWANPEGRVILTQDTDYLQLARTMDHAGIVYVRMHKYDVGETIRAVLQLWTEESAGSCRGILRYL